jgi:hypothetical protein
VKRVTSSSSPVAYITAMKFEQHEFTRTFERQNHRESG